MFRRGEDMGVLGLLGGLLGGGGSAAKSRSRDRENRVTPASQVSQSSADPTVKAKAAGKLALIKTGSAGVLNDTTSGRKKLLGN